MSTERVDKPTADESATAPEAEQPWLTPGVGGIGAASLLADAGHEARPRCFRAF